MPRFTLNAVALLCTGCAAVALVPPAAAQTLYVDPQISSASCANYNPATRGCGGGAAVAYRTLAAAASAAMPGQTVVLRGGTYNQALIPARSGTASAYITFIAHAGETATLSGSSLSPAIDISNRSYIRIEGLRIANVNRWLLALNAHRNVIEGNVFLRAMDPGGSSKTGMFFEESTYNRILNNTIDDSTQDNLALIKSDRNLVEGNTFLRANHTLFTIKCGNYNILRGNYFHNERQKIGEIYDCDGVGYDHDIYLKNATKYNVVEDNVFAYTPSSGNASPYAGIQFAGQNCIIRRNAFYDTTGPGIDFTVYGGEAEYAANNRVYNNVFNRGDFAGISIAPAGYTISGNQIVNNIFLHNLFVRNDTRWEWYNELNGKPVSFVTGRLSGFAFVCNALFNVAPGESYLITYGQRQNSNGAQHNVAWWQANHPALFSGNHEFNPLFVNENGHDYNLMNASPAIDAGAFLTRTTAAGVGTTITVADPTWFCDGFGIPDAAGRTGQSGDLIQLAGSSAAARVLSVNYATGVLLLDRQLTWTANQGVSLAYAGAAPDLGAFEFGSGAGCDPCDVNCDGSVNVFDIQAFTNALIGAAGCSPCAGDADSDGSLTAFDIQPFLECLGG